jgi:hypothetical protein
MCDEVKVLGPFQPSRFQSEVIEAELRPLLPPCCAKERIGVRTPHPLAASPPILTTLEWHQDGGGSAGTTHHMIVWASEDPTELKTSTGDVFDNQPGQLVWFDNTKAFHRQPTRNG